MSTSPDEYFFNNRVLPGCMLCSLLAHGDFLNTAMSQGGIEPHLHICIMIGTSAGNLLLSLMVI